MKHREIALLCSIFFAVVPMLTNAQLYVQWQFDLGGTNYEECTALQLTDDGGCVIAGGSESGATGNKATSNYGGADYWFVKVDSDGNKVWEQRYGGSSLDYPNGIQPTSDGGWLLLGQTASGVSGNKTSASFGNRDYWLVKTDAGGNKQWEKEFGGTSRDIGWCLTSTTNGYLLGGWSYSSTNGNKTSVPYGGYDEWIISIDTNGVKQWEASYGGSSSDYLSDAQPTADGGYILAGQSYSGVSGSKGTVNYGNSDCWIIKIDGTGNKQWEQDYGGTSNDYFQVILPLTEGGYLVAGNATSGATGNKSTPSFGLYDWWVLKLDAGGNKIWEKVYGGDQWDYIWGILPMNDGSFLLYGTSWSGATGNKDTASFGNSDCWLVNIDTDGNKLWELAFGGTNTDYAVNAIQATSDGGVLLGGYSLSDATGNRTVATYGDFDYWLIKLVPAPSVMIAPSGAGQVHVSWVPATPGFVLQEATNLTMSSWENSSSGSTNPAVVPATSSATFYRLFKP